MDVTFDCAGFNKTMSTALIATRPGGKVCLVGMGHHEMTVPLTPAAARYSIALFFVYIYVLLFFLLVLKLKSTRSELCLIVENIAQHLCTM